MIKLNRQFESLENVVEKLKDKILDSYKKIVK